MKWQPIETAPKDGTWILTYTEGVMNSEGPYLVVRYWNGEWTEPGGLWPLVPDYWMPLPEPPLLNAESKWYFALKARYYDNAYKELTSDQTKGAE